ncbi:reverse transcriptase domain-containing protein [Tanacetum coccineum]
MADHSQKWHDGTTSKSIRSSSNNDGLAALVNKLDNLGRDMKKLKESVHAIQVGCQICEGPHLDKDCPLNEEVKQVEEVWIKKLQENAEINNRNQSASLKNLETHIEQLTKEIYSDKTLNSSSEQIKTVTADQETSGLNKLHGVSFISGPENDTLEVLQHQLPPKELNPGSFTLPYTIGKFNFYAIADLGASINVMPRSIFEHLHFTNLKKTNMLCEMADMSKKAPLGIVENVLVKIDKFLFPSDFVILDNTPSETTILGRPFLATIHAEIDVFAGKISLGINEDRISFDTMRKDHNYTNPSEKNFMVNSGLINRPQSPAQTKYEKSQTIALVWDNRYAEWCDISPSSEVSSQESNKPRPRDYTFREWTLIKVGHTDISEPVKKALLKLWLIDCFQDNSAIVNNPTHRSFDDYKWEFNLEIDKLADEYEVGIGKKGHILNNIWEYCNQVHNKNYGWHNYEFENEECEEIGIEDEDYHPPEVQVETFKVKKYPVEGGQSFICVTKDLDNILPLGRKNGSKFKEMIRNEVENNKT